MGSSTTTPAPADGIETAVAPPLEITTLRQFLDWMAERTLSLVLTTDQIGKLMFVNTQCIVR